MIQRYLLVISLCVSVNCFADSTIYIKLDSEVAVDHFVLQLGDVATVITNNPSQSSQMLRLPIVNLQTLTSPIRITKNQIEKALLADMPEIQNQITWAGGESVLVSGAKHEIKLDAIIEESRRQLTDMMANQDASIQILSLNRFAKLLVPMGTVEHQLHFERAKRLAGNISIPLDILVDGNVFATPVLKFKIVGGQSPNDSTDVKQELKENRAKQAVPNSDKVKDVSNADESGLLIQKNQHVKVIYDDGPIHIESEGIALSDARLGELVKIKRTESADFYTGQAQARGVIVVKDN